MGGRVVDIFVAPTGGAPMQALGSVRAEAGVGLIGDRYGARIGTFSHKESPKRQVTLIEAEALEGARRDYRLEVDPRETRRNILVEGVALNHLVGREFQVGGARLRGIALCEPCNHLDELAGKPLSPAFVHRGGLNAEIIGSGDIAVGDAVETSAV